MTSLKDIEEFWNIEACGTQLIESYTNQVDFLRKYTIFRFRGASYILSFINKINCKDQRVLEIGCGNGVDGIQIARKGAQYTGVDLTPAAIEATKKHFQISGLEGSFKLENAEKLSFENDTFDIVYSFGVLHHTNNPKTAINEVRRVLKHDGRAYIMLYHKNSLNYYIRFLIYFRLRLMIKILSRLGRWGKDKKRFDQKKKTRTSSSKKEFWDMHYLNFLKYGWSYLSEKKFTHHCPDGPECEIAYSYTRREINELFKDYSSKKICIRSLPIKNALKLDLPVSIEKFLEKKLGWAALIEARK